MRSERRRAWPSGYSAQLGPKSPQIYALFDPSCRPNMTYSFNGRPQPRVVSGTLFERSRLAD
jgi:hypothetical protein